MKRINKKMIIMSLACILGITVLSGCGSASKKSTQDTKGAKEVTVGVTSFADTLEPTDQYYSWVITRYGVGENLVRFDENAQIAPLLAESYEVSEDGLTWTFKIREDVKFSNGDDMTPELVKASLDRTFELSDRAKTFFKPSSIEVDGQNIKIKTDEVVATLPGCLADPLFLIINTKVDNSNIVMEGPIGTGPYVFESFDPTIDAVVTKNENYWGGEVPLNKVTFKCIADQSTRSMALQAGEIQVAYNLKAENKVDFADTEKYEIQELESLRSTFAFMNQKGALGDIKLRQALISALDRETYTQSLLEGGAKIGKAPVPPTLDYGFDELVDENSFDPERAKALLEEAGYVDINGDGFVETPTGEPLNLNFVIYTSRAELGVYAQAAQVNLKEVGINVTLNTVSYETLLDIRDSGQYDLLIWNVLAANTGDPEKYLRENWHSEAVSNTTGYSNPEVDRMLDELSKTIDSNARRDLIKQIQQIIMNDAATVFFGYETTFLYSSKDVTSVKMYPMDYYWLTTDLKLAE